MKVPQVNRFKNTTASRIIVSLLFVSLFSAFSFAQKATEGAPQSEVAPTPIILGGNPSCATLNASTNPAFAHITEDWELKINTGTPSGTYPFMNGGVVEYVGPEQAGKSLTVVSASNPSRITSFTSQVTITAVIIKTGSTSYVYPYSAGTSGDTNLNTGANNAISHISFCFGVSLNPSAADATVSGRVVDSNGRGISGARIQVTNATTGVVSSILSSTFGYYAVSELESADTYIMTVDHRRYQFANNTRTFNLNEDLTNEDFVANP